MTAPTSVARQIFPCAQVSRAIEVDLAESLLTSGAVSGVMIDRGMTAISNGNTGVPNA